MAARAEAFRFRKEIKDLMFITSTSYPHVHAFVPEHYRRRRAGALLSSPWLSSSFVNSMFLGLHLQTYVVEESCTTDPLPENSQLKKMDLDCVAISFHEGHDLYG